MSNPFEKSLSGLTSVQLLEIVRNGGEYDPQAVSAATLILGGRDVRPEEYDAAEKLFHAQRRQVLNQEQVDGYKEKVAGLVSTITTGEGKSVEERWITYFLVLLFIDYAWICASGVKHVIRLFNYPGGHLDIFAILDGLSLVYLPVFFFLVYKRRKWGWVLVFVQAFCLFLNDFWVAYEMLSLWFRTPADGYFHFAFPTSDIVSLLISGTFTFFLYRQSVADKFGVTKELKVRTTWVAAGIVLLEMVAGYILS